MNFDDEVFIPRSGRPAPKTGDRVRVYRNLPLFKHRLFSILAMDGPYKGLVLGYSKAVCLEKVSLKVSERTRLKVVREKCRTVHAYAEGSLKELATSIPERCASERSNKITYNPFHCGYFYDRELPDKPVWDAPEIWTWGPDLIIPSLIGEE